MGNTTCVSIGIITVAHGDTYRAQLAGWVTAVNMLETQADAVIVVTDDTADAALRLKNLRATYEIMKASGTHRHHPQLYANQAMHAIDTDWICKMDADDRILPHAFNNMPDDCDVLMFGITHQNTHLIPAPTSAQEILNSPHNQVFSGSPYRKWLRNAAHYRDMIYEDWMFWIDCAKQNARFQPTGTVDYEYVMHGQNISSRADDSYWRAVVESLR